MSSAQAQPIYEKLYTAATSYTFDLIELPGDNILTATAATLLLDAQGNVIHASAFFGGGTYFVQTLKPASTNEFYFTSSTVATSCPWSGGSNNLFHPVIGKMDSLGNTLVMRKHELNTGICYGVAGGLEVTSDLGAVTWGRERNFYVMRVDSAFDHVWSKRIMHSGGFQFIKELPGGDLLAGINMDTAGVVITRMDAEGHFLWSKSYLRPRGMVHDALIESDSSFIITGYTDSTQLLFTEPLPASFQPKLFMLKIDGDGEIQWCRGWFSSPFLWYSRTPSRIRRTSNGSYVVLANIGAPTQNFWYRPFLMKTDTNGDTLWTRSGGIGGCAYITEDLLAHSDGSLMFSGLIYGDTPGTSSKCIFKTDTLGHFTCHEQYNPVQAVELFPVDSNVTLNSVEGMATVTPILVNDSIVDPNLFTDYDHCTFTTGMHPMQQRKPSVYPNPNTGRFTVEFADPLMAESYYSVYDALGKLLYQRPLPTGATLEEVDLSRYGRGSYVIKFTSPDGVCHEQVVVE